MALRPAEWTLHGAITVHGVRSGSTNAARALPTLLFENSYNIPLAHYRDLLTTLDEHFFVVAIEKNGLNNLGPNEPRTIAGHAALTTAFLQALARENVAPPQVIVGHSLGFATGYVVAHTIPSLRLLVGIAPLLPGTHAVHIFFARMLSLVAGDAFAGRKGRRRRDYIWSNISGYTARALRNISATFALLHDMATFRFSDQPLATPALLIVPTLDELVPRGSWSESDILQSLPAATIDYCEDPEHRHSLPLHHGSEIGTKIIDFFGTMKESAAG